MYQVLNPLSPLRRLSSASVCVCVAGGGGVIFKECDYFLHFGRQRGDRLTFLTVHGIWKHSVGEKISAELDPNPISNTYLL